MTQSPVADLFRGVVAIGGWKMFLPEMQAGCPRVANDHQARQMLTFKSHGTAAMGSGRLPGNMVVDTFAAIDSCFLRHESLDRLTIV